MSPLPFSFAKYAYTKGLETPILEREDHMQEFLALEPQLREALLSIPDPYRARVVAIAYPPWQLRHLLRCLMRKDDHCPKEAQMEALTDEDCAVVLDDKWPELEYPREKAVERSELLDGRIEGLNKESSARNTRKMETLGLATNPKFRYRGANGRERAKEKTRPRAHRNERLYYASLKENRGRKAVHALRQ